MEFLAFLGFLLAVHLASPFNVRGQGHDTFQQQEKGTGIYSRITHGFAALPGQFPYQVGLIKLKGNIKSTASGSLLSYEWVLTAAHSTINAYTIHVYLGQIKLDNIYTTVHRPSPKIIEHDGYNRTTKLHDIALIKIPPANSVTGIEFVVLPGPPPTSYYHLSGILAGWGKTSDSSMVASPTLQYAIFKVISNADCAEIYDKESMPEEKLCIEAPSPTSGCQGDSGGAFVMVGTNIQIGILSFGYTDGCEKGFPMAFTRVNHYLDWINRRIQK